MKFSTYLPSCFFLSFSTSESFKYCSLTLTQSNLSLFTGLECFQREKIQKIHSIMLNLPYSMVKMFLHKCSCFFSVLAFLCFGSSRLHWCFLARMWSRHKSLPTTTACRIFVALKLIRPFRRHFATIRIRALDWLSVLAICTKYSNILMAQNVPGHIKAPLANCIVDWARRK